MTSAVLLACLGLAPGAYAKDVPSLASLEQLFELQGVNELPTKLNAIKNLDDLEQFLKSPSALDLKMHQKLSTKLSLAKDAIQSNPKNKKEITQEIEKYFLNIIHPLSEYWSSDIFKQNHVLQHQQRLSQADVDQLIELYKNPFHKNALQTKPLVAKEYLDQIQISVQEFLSKIEKIEKESK